uniref:Zinc finger, RING-type n=1 Tax=Medicago truncatula TaxID=3880 RepID=A4Q379_MEDTR|nr:Zinc finger, RING-type [Medicago truncatula]
MSDPFNFRGRIDVLTNLNLRTILNRRVVEEQVECSICLSTPSSTLITRCTHVFCWNCIKKWFDHAKKNLSHVLIVKVYLQVMACSLKGQLISWKFRCSF